jgi:hypothetical protein
MATKPNEASFLSENTFADAGKWTVEFLSKDPTAISWKNQNWV